MRRDLLLLAAAGAGLAVVAWRANASTPAERDAGTVDAPGLFDQLTEALSGDSVSIDDKNVVAFLAMIRAAEGTASADGYRALFGYTPAKGGPLFDSFGDHPRVKTYGEFVTPGKTTYTTAAGAYQITATTFDRLKGKLELNDFTPASQDAIAVELLREAGALGELQAGNFTAALAKSGGIWASLPSSKYPQPKRTDDFVLAAYTEAGGTYA